MHYFDKGFLAKTPFIFCALPSHLGGVVDFHLCQQFSIDAEVAEKTSFVTDDAVALAGHRDEPGPLKMIRSLQSPQKVSCDGVDQTWTLCQSKTHKIPNKFLSQHDVKTVYFISISRLNLWLHWWPGQVLHTRTHKQLPGRGLSEQLEVLGSHLQSQTCHKSKQFQ